MTDGAAPRRLAEATWTEVDPAGSILVVPVGATEQHGPHLPLDTDTVIAIGLADGLARHRSQVVVAPALPIGASGEHAGFPGTLSLGTEALRRALVELARSADDWCGVLFVNWHGGNAEAVAAAIEQLRDEGRAVEAGPGPVTMPQGVPADAHAGRIETSLMLALAPETVRVERAVVGTTRPLDALLPELRAGGVRAVSESGVLGDPTGASADEGGRILDRLVSNLCRGADALLAPAPVAR